MTYEARRIVVSAFIKFPGEEHAKEVSYQIPADAFGRGGGCFVDANVAVAYEREAPYDLKLQTTGGVENAKRGSLISILGPRQRVPIAPPLNGVPIPHDDLKIMRPRDAAEAHI